MSYDKKTGLYTGYIYMIECDINHKKYIGQTTQTVKKRWQVHKHYVLHDTQKRGRLCEEMRNLGIHHFNHKILDSNSFKDKAELKQWLDKMERYYIYTLNTTDPCVGYNSFNGGHKNSIKTDTIPIVQYDLNGIILNIFDSHEIPPEYDLRSILSVCEGNHSMSYGCIWRKITDPFDKYPLPSTHALTQYYSIHNNNTSAIVVYDLYGHELSIYSNIKEAADKTRVSQKTIKLVCAGQKNYYKDLVFRYKGDEFDKFKFFYNKSLITKNNELKVKGCCYRQKVYVYNPEGNLIQIFYTLKDAINSMHIHRDGIRKSLDTNTPYIYQDKAFLFSEIALDKKSIIDNFGKFYKLFVYDTNNVLLGKFFNAYSISKKYDIEQSTVYYYLEGKLKTLPNDIRISKHK